MDLFLERQGQTLSLAPTKRTSNSNRSKGRQIGNAVGSSLFSGAFDANLGDLETFRNENSSMQAKYRCHRSLAKILKADQRKSVQALSEMPKRTVQRLLHGSKRRPKHRSMQIHCSALHLPIRCFQHQSLANLQSTQLCCRFLDTSSSSRA